MTRAVCVCGDVKRSKRKPEIKRVCGVGRVLTHRRITV
jgi:hypothetical protein